jgi:hypothetical protein
MVRRSFSPVILLLSLGVVASGCFSFNPSARAPAGAERSALAFAPARGEAILYLYVPRLDLQIAVDSSYTINEQHLGEVGVGYFRVKLRPGKHLITLFCGAKDEERLRQGKAAKSWIRHIIVEVRAGQVYYVRSTPWSASLSVVGASEGQAAIRKLKLYQGDFAVMNDVYRTVEDEAWEACLSGGASCRAFLTQYPESTYRSKALQLIENRKQDEKVSEIEEMFERDRRLPVDVRRDKYMVSLTSHLKNERYREALVYFDLLGRLDVDLPASFKFFLGESLLRTGNSKAAVSKLYEYIEEEGPSGQYYKMALELVNEAEFGSGR